MPPPDRLVRRHRHSLTNALILGGSSSTRAEWARAFHLESPLRLGIFVCLDCRHDEPRLRDALSGWLAATPSTDPTLIAVQHGTLFLDSIECLSIESQRLLLELAAAPPSERGRTEWAPSVGRLICGGTEQLVRGRDEGRFMLELFDALDKIRIDLDHPIVGAA